MNISCLQNELSECVQAVQRAISTKNTLPILEGILLETKGNNLFLSATDLDLGIQTRVTSQINSPGKLVVPGRYFAELVRYLPSEANIDIRQDQEKNVLILTYGNSEIRLNCYDAEQFPQLGPLDAEIQIELEPKESKKIFEQVLIGVSKDFSRPEFTGVLFEYEGNNILNFVSTDTHRLALRREKINKASVKDFNKFDFIVPGRTLMEINRLLKTDDNFFGFSFIGKQIVFKLPQYTIISRTIDASFPRYKEVLPADTVVSIKINTREFLESLERAALLAREEKKSRANLIKLKIKDHNLIVESDLTEVGHIHEEIGISKEGRDIEIAFNVRYLIDALKVLETEDTSIEISGSSNAAIMRPVEGDDYMCLILPVRLA